MPMFCVDKNDRPRFGHQVHDLESGCVRLPVSYFQLPIGFHPNWEDALKEAHEYYSDASACSCCKVTVGAS